MPRRSARRSGLSAFNQTWLFNSGAGPKSSKFALGEVAFGGIAETGISEDWAPEAGIPDDGDVESGASVNIERLSRPRTEQAVKHRIDINKLAHFISRDLFIT